MEHGFTAPWETAKAILSELQSLRVNVEVNVDDGYSGDVKFVSGYRTGASMSRFTATWYADYYIKKARLRPRVRRILRDLNDVTKLYDNRFIFRGEPALYPNVTSTLARRWRTADPSALKAIGESNFQNASQYLQGPRNFDTPEELERYKLDVFALIQHMGGATNLVDFTEEPWVALFFACADTLQPGHSHTVGRIWAFDQNVVRDDVEVAKLSHLVDLEPNGRWARQAGIVVVPTSGVVPEEHLREVALIPAEHKIELNDFLTAIGLTAPTIYGDIDGYIRYAQDSIGMDAVCHMIAERIRKGEYERASAQAERILMTNERRSGGEIGYYFRGLCHALQGRLGQARCDLLKFRESVLQAPEYAELNVETVLEAWERNDRRDYSLRQYRKKDSLKDSISLDVDERLWSIVLGTYTVRQL